jgi:DNA-binding NarL/FixJ family response regulator
MTIRILLADDHELFMEGLRHLLDAQPDMEVVAQAEDGRTAVAQAAALTPDLVLMDLSMPGMTGVEATRQIVADCPEVKVVCLSMHAESRFVEAAIAAGASGYLLKDCALADLAQAIHAVVSGQVYLSPGIAGAVVEAYKAGRAKQPESAGATPLTEREREVLQLIADGAPTRDIAAQLHVSVKTIGSHRENLMAKLDIHSVAGLTKYAIRENLTSAVG